MLPLSTRYQYYWDCKPWTTYSVVITAFLSMIYWFVSCRSSRFEALFCVDTKLYQRLFSVLGSRNCIHCNVYYIHLDLITLQRKRYPADNGCPRTSRFARILPADFVLCTTFFVYDRFVTRRSTGNSRISDCEKNIYNIP